MDEGDFGLLHSSEWRGLFQHLQDRAKIYVGVFVLGFVAGYPAAEVLIEWFLDAEGFIPEGVQIIILQPLEVILLQLRIAAQIGFGLLVVMLIQHQTLIPYYKTQMCEHSQNYLVMQKKIQTLLDNLVLGFILVLW